MMRKSYITEIHHFLAAFVKSWINNPNALHGLLPVSSSKRNNEIYQFVPARVTGAGLFTGRACARDGRKGEEACHLFP